MKKVMIIAVSVLCAFILLTAVGCNGSGENPPVNNIDATAPLIVSQPNGMSLRKGEATRGLEIQAYSNDNGALGYQWYRSENENGDGSTVVEGANKSVLTLDTSVEGMAYYRCAVTNTNNAVGGNKTATVVSSIAAVKIWSSAEMPRILIQPKSSDYVFGAQDEALAMEIEAAVSRGELSYQWYSSATGSYEEAAEIPNATSVSYVPDISRCGERFYYCEVTNVDTSASEEKVSVVNSKITRISIDYDYENFAFEEINDSTCKLTEYTGSSIRPYIPETDAEARTVVEIGAGVFANSAIVEVTVPDTVETLGKFNASANSDGVFAGCGSLQKINFNGHFKQIGDFTFNKCQSLQADTWLYLDRVERIGNGAFENMSLPEQLVIPATLTGKLGDWTFQRCKGIKEITFAGDKVTQIAGSVFAEIVTLESIVIPASVTSVGDCLQKSVNLKSVTFQRSAAIDGSITTGNPFGSTEYENLVIDVPADSYNAYVSSLGAYGKFVDKPAPARYTLTIEGATVDGKNSMELYADDTIDPSFTVVYDDENSTLGWLYGGGYYATYEALAQSFKMPYGATTVKALYDDDFTKTFTPSCKVENKDNSSDVRRMEHEKVNGFTGTRYKIDSKINLKIINGGEKDQETHGESDGVYNDAPMLATAKTCILLTFVNNKAEQISVKYEAEYWGVQGTVTVTLGANETKTVLLVINAKQSDSTPYHQLIIENGGESGYDITIGGRLPA